MYVLLKAVFPDALATELKQNDPDSAVQKDAYANKMVTGGRVNAFDALQVEPDGIHGSVRQPGLWFRITYR